jgi:hypothetical protein
MLACVAGSLVSSVALAQPGSPTYSNSIQDAVTKRNVYRDADGRFRWSITNGADRYAAELYERPTAQEYQRSRNRYGAKEYFEYLDIEQGRIGADARYIYAQIDLVGRAKVTEDGTRSIVGLLSNYGVRFSTNSDGRRGFMVLSDQPEVKNQPSTRWGLLGVTVFQDTNGDVGGAASSGPTGLLVSKTRNPLEEQGMNGYETVIATDGSRSNGQRIAWVRINPQDATIVEIAVDYVALGMTRAQAEALAYADLEANAGSGDPQNYHRNDKYSAQEAGSPNPGRNGLSEFGTQGCGNVYEVDTVRLAGTVPANASFDPSPTPSPLHLVWRTTAPVGTIPAGTNGFYRSPAPTSFEWKPIAGVPDGSWKMVGSDDMDADGTLDVVWHNQNTGAIVVWFMKPGQTWSDDARWIGTSDQSAKWAIRAVTDVNGDDVPDLVWQSGATGTVGAWTLTRGDDDRTFTPSWKPMWGPATAAEREWTVVGASDLSGDGEDDLVLRYQGQSIAGLRGANGYWTIRDGAIEAFTFLAGQPDLNWSIAGTGDADMDDSDDVFWRHATTGEYGYWRMNGDQVQEWRSMGVVDPRWSLLVNPTDD